MRMLCILIGLFSVQIASAEDQILLQHGTTIIRKSDLIEAVGTFVPDDRVSQFYSDEKRVRDTIASLLIQRKLAEEAALRNLSKKEAAFIDSAVVRARSQVQINYLVDRRKQPDFEAAAMEAYRANKQKYVTPEKIMVEHILVDSKKISDEDALERVKKVRELILNGEPFSDLAKKYSDDPSAINNGGKLGFFSKGAMVKEFEDAAFGLKAIGDVTAPVKTAYGYHVIRLVAREPQGVVPFEGVKNDIIKTEKGKFRDRVVKEEFDRLGAIEGVQVNQDAIKEIVENAGGK